VENVSLTISVGWKDGHYYVQLSPFLKMGYSKRPFSLCYALLPFAEVLVGVSLAIFWNLVLKEMIN